MNNLALNNFPTNGQPRIIPYPNTFEDNSIKDILNGNERIIKVASNSATYRDYLEYGFILEKIISGIQANNLYHHLDVRLVKGQVEEGNIVYRLNPNTRMRVLSSVNVHSEPKTSVLQSDVVLALIKEVAKSDGLDVDLVFSSISKFMAIHNNTVYVLMPVVQEN